LNSIPFKSSGVYPESPSYHKKTCGSGFEPRSFNFAAGSRSHKQLKLFSPDNRETFYLSLWLACPQAYSPGPIGHCTGRVGDIRKDVMPFNDLGVFETGSFHCV
jgi:hypothetical protein